MAGLWILAVFILSVCVRSLFSVYSCPIGFIHINSTRIGDVCIRVQSDVTFYEKQSRCHGNMVPLNFFQMPEFTIHNHTGEFWMDYKRTYEDGPFVNWLIGDNHIGEPAGFLQKGTGDPSASCSVVDLKTKNFRFVDCNETHSRFCVVPTYESSYTISWGCPTSYFSFSAPVPTCLGIPFGRISSPRRAALRARLNQANSVCNKTGGFLPNKGYIYSNHPEFTSFFESPWSIPLGIVRRENEFYWNYSEYLENIPVSEWNFKSAVDLDDTKPLVALSSEGLSWILESEQAVFFNVICEYFISLPSIALTIDFSVNGKDLILSIETFDIETISNIMCFTDSETYYPTEVKLWINKDEYFLETKNDGNYWCIVNNTLEYSSSISNTFLYMRNESALDRRFAVMICLMEEMDVDDVDLSEVLDFLNQNAVHFKDTIFHSLTLKRNLINTRQILFHANVYDKNSYDGNNFLSYEVTDPFKYGLVYVRNVAHCNGNEIEDLAIYHNKTYPLGTRILLGDCIIYVCSGSFDLGCYWDMIINSTPVCIKESKNIRPKLDFDRQLRCKPHIDSTTESTTTMSPEDKVSEIGNQLEELANSNDPISTETLTNVTNNISQMLDISNEVFIPKTILTNLDSVVKKLEIPHDANEVKVVQPNLAIVVGERTGSSPILGIRVDETDDGFDENAIHTITSNTADFDHKNKELIVEVPPNSGRPEDRLSFIIFKDNNAFSANDSKYNHTINSRVLSITLGQITTFASGQYVDILLKPQHENLLRNETKLCAFWDFQLGSNGDWSTQGCQLLPRKKHGLDVCRCKHLTHFAQIIRPNKDFGDVHYNILSIISYAGSFLSLAGILVIGLTGILFKSWRSDFSNKIWLNLSFSIGFLILLFLITAFMNVSKERITCLSFGIALHYSLLSSFCWMLISAVLSYQRLVRVFSKNSSHRLLKAFIVGWILPLLPIIILCAIDVDIYDATQEMKKLDKQFCYPSGISFWLGLILPIITIVIANTILFFVIIHSVFLSTKIQRHGDSKQLYRSITVSFLLFFLFGLTWIFGLLSENLVMAYLFCITSTLQGFVLFIFFVVGNKKTRDLWCVFLHIRKKRKIPVTSSMSRSASRGISSNGKTTSLKNNDYKSNMPKFLTGNFEDGDMRFS